jgi:monoamine oxidase
MRITRRNLIVAAALWAAGCRSAGKKVKKKEKIVVVGAGIAGLAAAFELARAGQEVVVLESRGRVGGRLFTDASLGMPVDLGASWIMGHLENPVANLVKPADLQVQAIDWESVRVFDQNTQEVPDTELAEWNEEFEAVLEAAADIAEDQDRDISMWDGIHKALGGEKLSARETRALDWLVGAAMLDGAADFERTSMAAEGGFDVWGDDLLVKNGYARVAEHLAAGLNVKTDERVKKVIHKKGKTAVITENNEYAADRIVITLPLGVLKKGKVAFDPPLSSKKRQAIHSLDMGTLNKVVLRYPKIHWPKESHFFGHMGADRGDFPVFLNLSAFSGAPLLMGFTGGRVAEGLENKKDATVMAQAHQAVREMFGTGVAAPEKMIRGRWKSDPHAFGSYSFVPVGGSEDAHDALAEPENEHLLFAGEATIRDYPATVHGAFWSGQREAARILDAPPIRRPEKHRKKRRLSAKKKG